MSVTRISIVFALVVCGFVGGRLSAPGTSKSEPIVHFRGKFDRMTLCEGDDGQLIQFGNYLSVECADRRKTAITAGPNTTFSHWWSGDYFWLAGNERYEPFISIGKPPCTKVNENGDLVPLEIGCSRHPVDGENK